MLGGLYLGGKKGYVTRYWERKAMFINQSNNGENNIEFPSQGSLPWMAFKVGLAGKCHRSIELERRERKEEKQKATISSEKRYVLLLTHLFWEVLFTWTFASYSGVFSLRVTWKIYIYLTAYLC